MSNDFPFGGHGSPENDLRSIEKSIDKDNMPPLRYKIIHWESSLTQAEREEIKRWITSSLKLLKLKTF